MFADFIIPLHQIRFYLKYGKYFICLRYFTWYFLIIEPESSNERVQSVLEEDQLNSLRKVVLDNRIFVFRSIVTHIH